MKNCNLVARNLVHIPPPITQSPIPILPLTSLPISLRILLRIQLTRKQHTLQPITPLAMQNLQNPDLMIIINRFMPVCILPNYRHTLHYPLKSRTNGIPFRRRLGPCSRVEGLRALSLLQRADHVCVGLWLVVWVVAEERRHDFERLRMVDYPYKAISYIQKSGKRCEEQEGVRKGRATKPRS